jgi:hypothetical protein
MDGLLSERVAALAERVEALQRENGHLWAMVGSGGSPVARPTLSRRGLLVAAAGGAAALVAGRAAPAAAANGDPVLQGQENVAKSSTTVRTTVGPIGLTGECLQKNGRGLFGVATRSTGATIGVWGRTLSTTGRGVFGEATQSTGTTTGVSGRAGSTSGTGVRGSAPAPSGTTYGVRGSASSPDGYGVFSQGRFKSTGRSFIGAPPDAPEDGDINNAQISFFLDQPGNELKVRVRYSDGTLKSGAIALI